MLVLVVVPPLSRVAKSAYEALGVSASHARGHGCFFALELGVWGLGLGFRV